MNNFSIHLQAVQIQRITSSLFPVLSPAKQLQESWELLSCLWVCQWKVKTTQIYNWVQGQALFALCQHKIYMKQYNCMTGEHAARWSDMMLSFIISPHWNSFCIHRGQLCRCTKILPPLLATLCPWMITLSPEFLVGLQRQPPEDGTNQGGKHRGKRLRVADAEIRVSEGVDRVVTFDITVTQLQTASL